MAMRRERRKRGRSAGTMNATSPLTSAKYKIWSVSLVSGLSVLQVFASGSERVVEFSHWIVIPSVESCSVSLPLSVIVDMLEVWCESASLSHNVVVSSSSLPRFQALWIFPSQPGWEARSTGQPKALRNSTNALRSLQEFNWNRNTGPGIKRLLQRRSSQRGAEERRPTRW